MRLNKLPCCALLYAALCCMQIIIVIAKHAALGKFTAIGLTRGSAANASCRTVFVLHADHHRYCQACRAGHYLLTWF
jgi:hypothetical protein